MAKELRQ